MTHCQPHARSAFTYLRRNALGKGHAAETPLQVTLVIGLPDACERSQRSSSRRRQRLPQADDVVFAVFYLCIDAHVGNLDRPEDFGATRGHNIVDTLFS